MIVKVMAGGLVSFVIMEAGAVDGFCVAAERAVIHMRADALSPAVCSVDFKTPVEVIQEVEVSPDGSLGDVKRKDIPNWVKVRVSGSEGYLPVVVMAKAAAIETAELEVKEFEKEAMKVRRGFSEVEDDVALSTMKGAAGKVSELAMVGSEESKLTAEVVISADEMSSFMFDGELESRPFRVQVSAPGQGRIEKLQKQEKIDPKKLEMLKKAAEAAKDSDDEELKLAIKAAQALASQQDGPMDALREFRLGVTVASRILPLYKVVAADDERSIYLNRVGRLLAAASNDPDGYSGYRFFLVEADDVNAFAVPGGFIFVTTGMMSFLKDEDELAAILAHEISHVELRHGLSAVGTEKVMKVFALAKDFALREDFSAEERAELNQLMDVVFKELFNHIRNGYSVTVESQADWRAIQLCARLGYDSSALVALLGRFKLHKGSYGGAGYPVERAADISRYRQELGFGRQHVSGRRTRQSRYRSTMKISVVDSFSF